MSVESDDTAHMQNNIYLRPC